MNQQLYYLLLRYCLLTIQSSAAARLHRALYGTQTTLQIRPGDNTNALKYMSVDVITNLEELVGVSVDYMRVDERFYPSILWVLKLYRTMVRFPTTV